VEADDAKARKDFVSGQTDILIDANTSDLLEAAGKSYRPEQYPYLSTTYLGFVVRPPNLASVDLRRALALALEPESLPPLLQGGQKVARGLIPPGLDGHDSGSALKGSLHEARAALARAGFPEGEGLSPLRLAVRRFDGAEKVMKYLIERWRTSLGIEVIGEVLSAEAYQSRHEAGNVDLFVQHWGADFPDAANFLEVFRSGVGTNRTGWRDSEYDQKLDRARDILDPRARASSLASAEKILLQRGVAIFPLFHRKNTVLIGRRVAELKISPLNYLYFDRIRLASAMDGQSQKDLK
jgi:oligopeptide transport system substrate-binding protein